MRTLLGGVTVPIVTPMTSPGVPSAEAGAPLLRALATAGITRLMLLGSNGEGPLIRTDRVSGFVVDMVRSWRELVPNGTVLVNITAAGTDEVLRRADEVVGADALVLSPPTYFRHRPDEVVAHYAALASHGLPVVAYNAPKYATPLTPSSVDGLVELPHVVGVKDSSGDPDMLAYLIAAAGRRSDFTVSQGDEKALASGLRAGARGIVPGTANLSPRLAVEMVAAFEAGHDTELDRLQDLTNQLAALHAVRPGVPSVKALLARRRLCPSHAAPPLTPCTAEETSELVRVVGPLEEYMISE